MNRGTVESLMFGMIHVSAVRTVRTVRASLLLTYPRYLPTSDVCYSPLTREQQITDDMIRLYFMMTLQHTHCYAS